MHAMEIYVAVRNKKKNIHTRYIKFKHIFNFKTVRS